MALTALEIKDKTFKTKFRGYSEEEVNEFLEIVVDDYEALVRKNRDNEAKIRELEEKLSYFDEMKESLSQSVILAQETAEKVKSSANAEATNLVSKATYDAQHLLDESKAKANQLLRDATDEAKRVAIETEELKRQTRVFHQRLVSAIESQLSLSNSPEWDELLQPTAVYLQNSDAAFKEVVKTVLNEDIPEADDSNSFDATRQFTPEELEELQRRVEESNKELEAYQMQREEQTSEPEVNLSETQTFKLNI
ncbi:TPA: DivIVA domain-containing protein [Streptococcus equi subsp. zooepidemicus]|uniref:Putative cell-division protein DivIVA n=1 Tax=Streptococcus equi subsp. zooepidemicus (strain H70) TaxID=553483 RepID=C0MD46_STRS7|nr:DivIVA domain-containing protein [Streptococcus equi]KIS08991.1 cell-division initiation protein [Streptococcus equi subsp. zooepidemicus Sz5]MCD3389162.1 DivIVA domain-containing protein [Streptococcus equi subsp. zooepidemicus]MCD3398576.1 DivIVA domain-containing protein [Streptococcus equi subsp. zooepidemicus]MCD3407033.1 DivIVA domain-containing protein [Streptococcus equi subsp. zooepidemicus]MCD3466312.1 DivIVA domain-containing protein [Streptococcus equi subsp. zooepidemicus]